MNAELLVQVMIEPEYGQITMSVVGFDPDEPGICAQWSAQDRAVSGRRMVLVATRADDSDPVTVTAYRGRPPLPGWTHIHTARLIVEARGLIVGMTVSAVEHPLPAPAGLTTVEVWTRPADWPAEVTFVLQP